MPLARRLMAVAALSRHVVHAWCKLRRSRCRRKARCNRKTACTRAASRRTRAALALACIQHAALHAIRIARENSLRAATPRAYRCISTALWMRRLACARARAPR
eukprot:scaffold33435_cov32-Tisochrysis_lutea.AAC.1